MRTPTKLVIVLKEEDPAVCSRGGDDLTKVVLKRRVCWLFSEDKLMPQEGFGKLYYEFKNIILPLIGNTPQIL
jgi:hypothetical protein